MAIRERCCLQWILTDSGSNAARARCVLPGFRILTRHMKVIVTGALGYIGRHALSPLAR
jgi:hypothetical protein